MREGLQHRKPNTSFQRSLFAFGACLAALLPGLSAHAVPKGSIAGGSTPCASVISQGGSIRVLDESRTQILEIRAGKPIPCGSWVSTEKGWMIVRHKDGHQVHVGSGTFLHFPARGEMEEQIVLYKGQIYLQPEHGSGELRVLTANARARTVQAKALVVFSGGDETTQLISLETAKPGASLENRFETSRKMTLKAGEATSLNMTALRVVPETPQAVSLTELKLKLDDLHVSVDSQREAILAAKNRQDRKFAASFAAVDPKDPHAADQNYHRDRSKKRISRAPASARSNSYLRHPIPEEQKEKLKKMMMSRLVGGAPDPETLLRPGSAPAPRRGPASKGRVIVEELGGFKSPRRQMEEDAEKKRLIEELSRIRLR